jgi:AcrR family transcriptional regulator
VGTVYNHFEDRGSLLAGLVETRRKELARKLHAALARTRREPFEAQLRTFLGTLFEHFDSHRPFLAIMLQTDSARLSQPSEAMRELRRHADALVTRGVRNQALRMERASLWGALLFGTVRSLLVHELLSPGKLSVAERTDAAARFFLEGAAAR